MSRRLDLLTEITEAMEALGWGPYQADHEDANGQFEINFDFADCLVNAMTSHHPRQFPSRTTLPFSNLATLDHFTKLKG